MCNCINIEIGTYANQTALKAPEWSTKGVIGIDNCILDEVKKVWSLGIVTNGHCCGHNKENPYIGVSDKSIEQMKQMGYTVQFNPNYPDSENTFDCLTEYK